MRLGELVSALDGVAELPGPWRQREVTDLVQDSRKASPGAVFVAVRGFHSDGHQFIPQAVRQGAAAVVAEDHARVEAVSDTLVIRVPDSRRALARLAARFYEYPSRRLALAGITGTNGKTTTSYLVRSIIEAAGHTAGLIGTIDYRIGDRVYPAPNTTPESLDLQQLLDEMVRRGAQYCVMEVSSHALALGRTDGCEFRAAAFTNLSQDHLDFHGTMEDYFQAKLQLFSGLAPDAVAVVNRDDERADDIIANTRARVITFGHSDRADVRTSGTVSHGLKGLAFTAATPSGAISIRSPLVGRHNISNILAAVGIGLALGFSADAIATGIRGMQAVPGRMEMINEGEAFGVIVDYAHTEDALVRLLEAVREVAAKRVITVFGCGGDRDRTKRPRMGAAAMRGSDIVIVTSDNPRNEDALAIIGEIEAGMRDTGVRATGIDSIKKDLAGKRPYLVIPDRADAIGTAVSLAAPGDVVVLAGKGHEDYQIVGEEKHHFDDREQARTALMKRAAELGVPPIDAFEGRRNAGQGVCVLPHPSMNDKDRNILQGLQEKLQQMEIRGVSIDSRTVREGELFIAIRGERYDGHDFVPDAIRKGAWGAIVDRNVLEAKHSDISGLRNVISMEDTLISLQEMSLMHRKKFLVPVIAVTGSNGKTTTKEMLGSILLQRGPVLKNEGNLNNHIGVPLTLLKLEAQHKAAIIEMGMSGLGEIGTLARLAMPDVGVITNIGPAHLQFLGSTDTVARAKGELVEAMRPDGTAVLNADDRYFTVLRNRYPGRVLSFGIDREADVRAGDIMQARDRTDLTLHACGRSVQVRLRTVGRHNVYNALGAAAAALAAGMPLEAVKFGLEEFRPVAMRSELKEMNGRTVLADYYNANPASVKAALETLASVAGGKRTVAVLGDMLELGNAGPEEHREIGRTAARLRIDLLICVGPLSRSIAEGAATAGMARGSVFEAETTSQGAALLRELSRPEDIVLVKGSRGMKMEKVLEGS
jgi:murE/murF fusion protein